jgi:hypothetical protein
MHIESVQRANREYDAGSIPSMLINENFNVIKARDIIDQIFSLKNRTKSLNLIDYHQRLWEQIIGTRGYTGRRANNAHTMFNALFETDDLDKEEDLDESKLDELETGQ